MFTLFSFFNKKLNKTTDVLTFVSNIEKKINKDERYCDIMLSAETLYKDAIKNKYNPGSSLKDFKIVSCRHH